MISTCHLTGFGGRGLRYRIALCADLSLITYRNGKRTHASSETDSQHIYRRNSYIRLVCIYFYSYFIFVCHTRHDKLRGVRAIQIPGRFVPRAACAHFCLLVRFSGTPAFHTWHKVEQKGTHESRDTDGSKRHPGSSSSDKTLVQRAMSRRGRRRRLATNHHARAHTHTRTHTYERKRHSLLDVND